MPEIRCENKFFGTVSNNSIGEFRSICKSHFCRIDNEVVEHLWNLEKIHEDGTIRPTATQRFKRPH